VESKLLAQGITEDTQCFAHAFGVFSPQTGMLSIFEGDKTFEDLKNHLLQEYGPSNTQDNHNLLDQTQEIVGDPRVYLSKLKKILQDAQTQKDLIQKLPERIRRVLQVMPLDATAEQVTKKAEELRRSNHLNGRWTGAKNVKMPAIHIIKHTLEQTTPKREDETGEMDEGGEEEILHLQPHGPPDPSPLFLVHQKCPRNTFKVPLSMDSPTFSKLHPWGTGSDTVNVTVCSIAMPTSSILPHQLTRVVL